MTAFVSTDISVTNGSTTITVNDNVDFSQVSTSSVLFINNNSPVIVDAGTAPDTPTSGASQLTLRTAWVDATVTNGEALLLVGMNALVDAITKANDSGTILANMTAAQADLYLTNNAAYPIQVNSSQTVNVPTWPYLESQFSNGIFTTLTSSGDLTVNGVSALNGDVTIAGGSYLGINSGGSAVGTSIYSPTPNEMGLSTNGIEFLRADSSQNATFASTVKSLSTLSSEVSSTSTNIVTNNGGALNLTNTSAADGNFNNIGSYNSNSLVTSQISMSHPSIAGRTGQIDFLTHNGTTMASAMTIDSSGAVGIGVTPLSNVRTYIGAAGAGASNYSIVTTDSAGSSSFAMDGDGNGRFYNNVGIGIAPSANSALYVSTSQTYAADLRNTNSVGYGMYLAGGSGVNYALSVNDYNNNNLFEIEGGGNAYHSGNVGIGIAPTAGVGLRVLRNNADSITQMLENSGTGDVAINFLVSGVTQYTMGIDNSDSDKFKISQSGVLGTTDRFTLDTSGNVEFSNNVGIGVAPTVDKLNIVANGTANIRSEQQSTAANSHINFRNPNGEVGSITTSGSATSYNTSSDPRLKDFLLIQEVLTERGFDDYDSMINADFEDLYNTSRWFKFKGEDRVTHGFDAHACIDAGLDMGTEGQGPRELEIGDVYETEEIPEITEEVTEEVQVTVTKTRETTSIEVIDGVPTQVTKTEEYEEPVFEDIAVVDIDGNPVMQSVESGEFVEVVIGQDEEGNNIVEEQPVMVDVPVTHSMPVMETITKTVVVQEAETKEKIVTSAGVDQAKAVPILLAKQKQEANKVEQQAQIIMEQQSIIADLLVRVAALEA